MWPLLLLACAPEPTPKPVDTGSPPPGPEASLTVLTSDGLTDTARAAVAQIGRASCRERVCQYV